MNVNVCHTYIMDTDATYVATCSMPVYNMLHVKSCHDAVKVVADAGQTRILLPPHEGATNLKFISHIMSQRTVKVLTLLVLPGDGIQSSNSFLTPNIAQTVHYHICDKSYSPWLRKVKKLTAFLTAWWFWPFQHSLHSRRIWMVI